MSAGDINDKLNDRSGHDDESERLFDVERDKTPRAPNVCVSWMLAAHTILCLRSMPACEPKVDLLLCLLVMLSGTSLACRPIDSW